MRIRIDLDPEEADRLINAAGAEKRPVEWQAQVMLRRALGLPFPKAPLEPKGAIHGAS